MEAVATFLIIVRTHMNIEYIIKVKFFMLTIWSYIPP